MILDRGIEADAGESADNLQVCQPGSCPTISSAQYSAYPTIAYNHMPGALYWDAGINFNIWGSKAELYGKVNNIANLAPPISAGTLGFGGSFNGTIYDVVGRMYYAGFRIHL